MTDRHGKARIYCYQGRQAKTCKQRSVLLDVVEAQLAAYLATFHLPEATVAQVIRLQARATDQRDDAERRRREIAGRIERIAELYTWGDLTREAYRAERERLEMELAGGAGNDGPGPPPSPRRRSSYGTCRRRGKRQAPSSATR